MGYARVWNDNVHPHVEKFKRKEIRIEPKAFVEMEWEDAIEFRGQFTPIEVDGAGQPKATSFKMIRVEKIPETFKEPEKEIACQACGMRQESMAALSEHIRQNHVSAMVDKDAKDELVKKGK